MTSWWFMEHEVLDTEVWVVGSTTAATGVLVVVLVLNLTHRNADLGRVETVHVTMAHRGQLIVRFVPARVSNPDWSQ